MKPFTQYLQEMNKLFEFCIKIANCDLDKDQMDRLKGALEGYSVESISNPKRLPIQEHADFIGLGPCECHVVEVALRYPVVTDQVQQIAADALGIPRKQVCAWTRGQMENAEPVAPSAKAKDGSVLNNPDLESDPKAQDLVGEKRRESMLKELETRKYEFAAKVPEVKVKELVANETSPVGSKQNKIPSPVKGN